MEKSPSIVNIAKALCQFQTKMGKVSKDSTNPFFNSKYASLSNILEAIKTPLEESGLSFSQFPTGQNGLTSILMHAESGEYMQSDYFMNPLKSDPQAQGSAISYMRRYALAAILGLNIDDDDDGNAATHGSAKPKADEKQNTASNNKPDDNRPWLNDNTEIFNKIVDRLKNRTTTIEQIQQHYKLSKTMKSVLQEVIDKSNN